MHNIIGKYHTSFEFILFDNQLVVKIKVCKPTFFICQGWLRQELFPEEGRDRWFLWPAH